MGSSQTGLEIFLSKVPSPAKVLVPGCDEGSIAVRLAALGHDVLAIDQKPLPKALEGTFSFEARDVRLFSPPQESFDGIYCHRLISYLGPEEVRRVMMIFFRALKPKTGVLFLSHLKSGPATASHGERLGQTFAYDPEAFQSLLRQSGFLTELKGTQSHLNQDWNAYVCRRIS
ncbi:MAG: class I SAM-dependent methyltransferase [Bdellovibrionales bacterium]|nr:class I SAM-dependent methyltransferase [Bdellovibrionales bacterium]